MNRRTFFTVLSVVFGWCGVCARATGRDEMGAKLLATTDASAWAKEFVRTFGGDEELMRAWFANAIMTGWDHGVRRYAERIAPKTAREWRPSEAVYAFAGWLTSRREPVTMSATHDAAEPARLVASFIDRHSLSDLRDGWEKQIVPEVRA